MATRDKPKSRKTASAKVKIKDIRIRKTSADKVKGGMVPGPEDLK